MNPRLTRHPRRARPVPCLLALAAAMALGAGSAAAATSTWACIDAKWETAACWSPAGVPASGSDIVVPLVTGTASWLRFDATTGTRNVSTLQINAASTSSFATVALSGGTLNLTSYLDVGTTGSGRLQQTAGTLAGTMLRLGSNDGGNGSYTFSGGALNLSSWAVVGYVGTGSVTQSGGSLTASNMDVGAATTATGSYTLSSNGTVTVGSLWVAENGTGSFTQGGSSTVSASNLYMGGPLQVAGKTSSYNMNGGTLNFGSGLYVGYQGDGSATFAQAAGTVSGPAVLVGQQGSGSYTLSGGTLSASTATSVGNQAYGSFTQTGGTHTTARLQLGISSGSTGVYYLRGGTLNADALARGTGSAVFSWTGGTLNLGEALNLTGSGFFGNALSVGNGKTLTSATAIVVAADGQLTQSSGGLVQAPRLENSGDVVLQASTLNLSGTGASNNLGNLSFVGGVLAGSSPLNNYGSISGSGTLGGGAFTNRGVLRPSGGVLVLSTNAANLNYGSVELQGGAQLRLNNALANHGVIALDGGTLDVAGAAGTVTNEVDGVLSGHGSVVGGLGPNRGLISVSGGMLSLSSALTNHGQIMLNGSATGLIGGGTLSNAGTLQGAGYVANAVLNSGTIEASGGTLTLAGSGNTNTGAAVISVGSGAKLLAAAGLASNAALIQLDGGTFDNGGRALTNSGRVVGHGNLRTGGLTNDGQVSFSFGDSQVAGSINNRASGLLVVSNGARTTFADAVVNAGELRISAGGAANFFGQVSGAGAFNGDGQARFEGGFSPGASPALVTVNFSATYAASSPILMELGGTTPGNCDTCADKIIFTKQVTLQGGPLNVVWWNGHAGQAGEVYDLFDFNAGVVGQFGQINLPTLAPGLAWQTAHLYDNGELRVAAVPEPGTWAMWLAGVGLMGSWLRGRRDRHRQAWA